jgi:hypothetical protein
MKAAASVGSAAPRATPAEYTVAAEDGSGSGPASVSPEV